jgi:hypothetical protein
LVIWPNNDVNVHLSAKQFSIFLNIKTVYISAFTFTCWATHGSRSGVWKLMDKFRIYIGPYSEIDELIPRIHILQL